MDVCLLAPLRRGSGAGRLGGGCEGGGGRRLGWGDTRKGWNGAGDLARNMKWLRRMHYAHGLHALLELLDLLHTCSGVE